MGPRGALSRRGALAALVGAPLAAAPLAGCDPRAPDGVAQRSAEGGFLGVSHERGHHLRAPAGDAPAPGQAAAPAPLRHTDVLIAGGGIAGLAAARALRLAGIDDLALLELEDETGGNSRATTLAGLACPLGAHYLPLPGDDAHEVQDLLEELGLRRRVAGRWVFDERHLCHAPQERLYFNGAWQEGLLPLHGVGRDTLAQYGRFARAVQQAAREAPFALPAVRAGRRGPASHAGRHAQATLPGRSASAVSARHLALDAQRFDAWLDAQGLGDAHLRAYLDYCCRDDYGAGLATVSAWAGLHYFASRHGFSAPDGDSGNALAAGGPGDGAREAVLTWPEGNAWLARRLAQPLGGRACTGRVVRRIAVQRHGVQVDAWVFGPDGGPPRAERWLARQVVVALPVHVAARVLDPLPPMVQQAAAALPHASWVVTNLRLHAPLHPPMPANEAGPAQAAPAWDNVIHGSGSLGYVDAGHQRLDPTPGPTVLTHYHALGVGAAARERLQREPWTHWRERVLAELSPAHPDLPRLLAECRVTRHGHAMACPVPGTLARLRQPGWPATQVLDAGLRGARATADGPAGGSMANRLAFAHADWAGYSVFEEAFTLGHAAGLAVARRLRG